MKYILISLMLLSFTKVNGQKKDTVNKCPIGYRDMPGMSTTSLVIKGGECLPDSAVDKLWAMFFKNLCGETSSGEMILSTTGAVSLSHMRTNNWVNDSVGCVTEERWEKVINGNWVKITKQEYEKLKKLQQ